MAFIVFKSFIPEFFLSFCILFQLVYNALIVNVDNKYPILTKEMFLQTGFILVCLVLLFTNLNCEAFFSNFLFLNDSSTIIMKLFVSISGLCIVPVISQNFSLQKLNFFEYFSIYLLALLALLLLISAADMLSAYLVIEMQALCFYVLASFNRNSAFSIEAGIKYFLSGSFISGIFLAGCSILYGLVGTLNFNHLNLLLSLPMDTNTFFWYGLLVANVLIVITFLFKLAVVPFHFWAPDVYEGSPLASTIIFSILPKISLVYIFIKWLLCLSYLFTDIFIILEYIGLSSIFIGAIFALRQRRLKRLMIYSSISQLGFIIIALSNLSLNSLSSVFFFLVIYILSGIVFWSNLSSFYNFQKRIRVFYKEEISTIFLASLSNFFTLNKAWCVSLLILFFSLAGLPPFSGFFAKVFVIASIIDSNNVGLGFIALMLSTLSAFYYLRFLKVVFFEPKEFSLKNNTSQIIFSDAFFYVTCCLNAFLLFLIIYLFFNPTLILLICHQIIMGFYFF